MSNTGTAIAINSPVAPTRIVEHLGERQWRMTIVGPDGPRPAGVFDKREIVDFLRDIVDGAR